MPIQFFVCLTLVFVGILYLYFTLGILSGMMMQEACAAPLNCRTVNSAALKRGGLGKGGVSLFAKEGNL